MDAKEHEQERDKAAAKQRGEAGPGKKGAEKNLHPVHNHRPTILHAPPGNRPDEKPTHDAQGRQLATSPVVLPPSIQLKPGLNKVSAEDWQKVKSHPVVKMWMDEGWITEGDQKDLDKPEGPEAPPHLRDVKPEQAMRAVESENDPEVLQRWLQTEKRDDVKQAISRKLEQGRR